MKKTILIVLICFSSVVMSTNLFQSIEVLSRSSLSNTELSAITASIKQELLLDGTTEIGINLPEGGFETLVFDRLKQHSKNSYTWFGHVKHYPGSTVYFSVVDGHIAGTLQTEKETFEFTPMAKNEIRLAALATEQFAECEAEEDPMLTPVFEPTHPVVPSGVTVAIDVMVMYTPQARDAAGGSAGIEATAQAAIDAMNLSFENSNVDAEATLSYAGLANYNDSGSSSDSLDWLVSDSTVAQLRTAYGADMVSLLADDIGSSCGRGYVMRSPGPGFASAAFQVTSRGCAVGNLSFAHEFGHNMGLEHDPENGTEPGNASNPWSFAHYHDNSYRTVMSYSSGCPNGCSRRPYFSNPDVQYNGLDTGIVDTRDNARTLRQTTAIVAAFRPETNDTIYQDGFE